MGKGIGMLDGLVERLTEMFKGMGLDKSMEELMKAMSALGIDSVKASLIQGIVDGWLEEELNSDRCPFCSTVLGEYIEPPVVCFNCGKTVDEPVRANPLRLYLAIANNSMLWRETPDQIKSIPLETLKKLRLSNVVIKATYGMTPHMFIQPILIWMKKKRPDLYYTIAFYPEFPPFIDWLYDLSNGLADEQRMREIAEQLGINSDELDRDMLLDAMKTGLDNILTKRGVSTRSVKWFAMQLQDIYIGLINVLRGEENAQKEK